MEEQCKDESKKKIFAFGIILLISIVFVLVYLILTGNTPQTFTDVVQEWTSKHGSNKSAERNLFYILAIGGSVAYGIFFFYTFHNSKSVYESIEESEGVYYTIIGLLLFFTTDYFIYSRTNWLLFSGIITAFILYIRNKKCVMHGVALLFLISYAICGIYRVYVLVGGTFALSMMTVCMLSTLIIILIAILGKNKLEKVLFNGIMLTQILIPFTLLVFLASNYSTVDTVISISNPFRIVIIICLLMTILIVESLVNIKNNWGKGRELGSLITYGTCISIMNFNRFSGTGAIVSSDMHHPFENIIGYSQIFELGQEPFSEYIPISGMYSVVHGFFMSFFGKGLWSHYYIATNLFYLFVIVGIVVLLKKHFRGEWVLFVSLIFIIIDYDRVCFILPIMLLLSLPKLIERKNLWLKVWFLSSYIYFLYYPVFGTAVCVGFMPMGIWQIVRYIKTGELKEDIKQVGFWIRWILCFLPVFLGIELLVGTIKHTMAMGNQTIYADGISRFGQVVPDDFFSYIQQLPTRLVLYYIFSYLTITILIWLSVALFLGNGNVFISDNKRMVISDHVPAFISLSIGIILLVSFAFTVMRLDVNSIYARNTGVVYASFVMLILIVSKYVESRKSRFWVYGFAIFTIAIMSGEGFKNMDLSYKLESSYKVPEGYLYIENDQVERMGTCFIDRELYYSIKDSYDYYEELNERDGSLGLLKDFGYYYLCNAPGDSVIQLGLTIKGYGAVEETLNLIRNNKTIVGSNIDTINNYYFYYWLINSGEYVWNPDKRIFTPNDGTVTIDNIKKVNKTIDLPIEDDEMRRTANSWGMSIDTLMNIFSETNIPISVSEKENVVKLEFDKKIYGNDADFLFIEFENTEEYSNSLLDMDRTYYIAKFEQSDFLNRIESCLTKREYNPQVSVHVSWEDDIGNSHSLNCDMCQGKLLIPVGSGRGWLLNEHSEIAISVKKGEQTIDVPQIVSVKMLKLREVN